jgi:NodT family efflux transporter outer membrane factor (OMF) lipoprotein
MMMMMKATFPLRLCMATGVATLAAACSFAPSYKQPSTDLASSFKESGEWHKATPMDHLDRGDWWRDYHDAALTDLQGRLESGNPSLAAAAAHYEQAHAYLGQVRSSLFPSLDSSGFATRNRQSDHRPLRSSSQPDEYDDHSLGATLTYEVDLWGRVRNLVAAGSASSEAAAADFASARLSLHAELANNYITLRGLDAQEKLLTDTVATYERALNLTQSRFQGGIASALDVSRAQTQLENARAAGTDILGSRALYEHAIASLIGVSASKFNLPAEVVELHLPSIPATVPSVLLERRPDIAAAERRAAAANAMIGVERAAFFPTVSLTGNGGFENTGGADWIGAPNSFWSVGPRFNLALFDAGKRHAVDRQARAAFDEASEKYRGTTLSAFQQVEDNLALLRVLDKESGQEDAAVTAAQRTLGLAMNRYENGAVNYLEVVDSQTAALQAQQKKLILRDRQLRASVGLIRALGGGWSRTHLPDTAVAKNTDGDASPEF